MIPTFDADGYPTDDTLDKISGWFISGDKNVTLDACRELWDYCLAIFKANIYSTTSSTDDGQYTAWTITTGGWSGNELVIGALKDSPAFMGLCWVRSDRYGKHEFRIPKGGKA